MKRIFVVGCPRSGTTLVQSILAGSSDLLSLPETHVLRRGIGRNGTQLISPLFRSGCLDALAKEVGLAAPQKGSGLRSRLPLDTRTFVRNFIGSLDEAAAAAGKKGWIEKTPEHVFYCRELMENEPDISFVHVVRNPRPTVVSIVDMWRDYTAHWPQWRLLGMRANDLRLAATRGKDVKICLSEALPILRFVRASTLWNDAIQATLTWIDRPNHLLLNYEMLTESPQEVVRGLCTSLDIEFNPVMLTPERQAKALIKKNETWKRDNAVGIRKASNERYTRLDESVKAAIERMVSETEDRLKGRVFS